MQFESWEDAVKKAKAKVVEEPLVVADPDPAPSTGRAGSIGFALEGLGDRCIRRDDFHLGFFRGFFPYGRARDRPSRLRSSIQGPSRPTATM